MGQPIKNLYVHIPFCVRCCSYCDFNRVVYDPGLADVYLDALGMEFAARADGMAADTVYIGGGTPTALGQEQLETLCSQFDFLDLSGVREFTVEANPGTLNIDKLVLLRDSGVTRVSLGVQTFNQRGLEILGRIHDAKAARYAVALVQEAGIPEFSLDLIYGWPGQALAEWEDDLRRAVGLGAAHLSCYSLTYLDNTPLAKKLAAGEIVSQSEEEDLRFFNFTREWLAGAGLAAYEISNFARPGHESLHNTNYWQGGTYVGLGAGAHSYDGRDRFANCLPVREYVERMNQRGEARDVVDSIPPAARARECGAVWLRMRDGIERGRFQEVTGFQLDELWAAELPPLLADGWLEWAGGWLRLTPKAVPVADAVLEQLI